MARSLQSSRNMYRVTLLLLFVFKFIGLATVTVSSNQGNSKGKWRENALHFTGTKIEIVYNMLLSCLILATNYVTVPALYSADYTNKTSITTLMEIFQGVIGSLLIFLTLLYYCMNQSALVRIGNYLIEAKDSLRRLQKPIDEKRVFRLFFVVYLLNFSLIVCLWVTDEAAFHNAPIVWLANILPTIFVSMLYIQYFSVLTCIDAVFSKINSTIQDIHKSGYDGVRPNILQHTRRICISPLTVQLLVQVRNLHEHLCDVSGKVSQFYAPPILMATFFTFVTLLYNTYYLVEPFLSTSEYLDPVIMINTVFWLLALLYPFNLLTNKITSVTNEIERTGGVVHTLLNCTIDRGMKTELERFSLQLLHRKIRFTANGYLELDNASFQSMLSTVTMYMVVLIQFEIGSSNPEDLQCNCTKQ
ncbi:Putative gustatory receptor 28a [Habropoda laboriosa]|uniref:Gustatory receptor n=1 Tax=Habropoda laboriosa TaxID=597456 RepID=A0A0L7RBA5_9HYME|nr:PREDICTED: putative gustatory receptor 28b [Habropoda laboriosa]KOC68100.1 Putative gustatory receptor 28a [Habropoda laboriosa]